MLNLRNKKILIVDEHEEFRKSLRKYLLKGITNIKICEASSGESGIKKALAEHPDVALIDIESGGIGAASIIHQNFSTCKNIILTNDGAQAFRKVTKGDGITAYVDKNEIVTGLLPIIKNQLPKGEEK